MKLKLDQNLGTRGESFLRQSGFDVSTTAAQGLARAADDTVIAACALEGRALITLDMDFANPLRHPPSRHAGVVVLRLHPSARSGDIEAGLRAFVATNGDADLTGRLLIVDGAGRVREYRPFDP